MNKKKLIRCEHCDGQGHYYSEKITELTKEEKNLIRYAVEYYCIYAFDRLGDKSLSAVMRKNYEHIEASTSKLLKKLKAKT